MSPHLSAELGGRRDRIDIFLAAPCFKDRAEIHILWKFMPGFLLRAEKWPIFFLKDNNFSVELKHHLQTYLNSQN